ncbi:unnamed protein product [Gongylonema pulchrum]|uniref:Uncharacterized protein n=1 Tax=Gongylonema pulchrum TaxID=637853 RepID=A0A183DHY1_9BILA|nr:unnamed protein product [Gongylonema pulchrum]
MKSLNVVSWHYQTPERRALKRNRLGPPDVYPQDVSSSFARFPSRFLASCWGEKPCNSLV